MNPQRKRSKENVQVIKEKLFTPPEGGSRHSAISSDSVDINLAGRKGSAEALLSLSPRPKRTISDPDAVLIHHKNIIVEDEDDDDEIFCHHDRTPTLVDDADNWQIHV